MPKVKKAVFAVAFCLSLSLGWISPVQTSPSIHRALFVSVIQDPPVLASRDAILELLNFSKKARVGTIFIQVYRGNQSWFPSKTADDSPYEACLISAGEDPLAYLIQEAHASGIQVHAWLNLLSLSANAQAPLLKKYGPEILTRNHSPKKSLDDYKIDEQFFLDAGDPRVANDLSLIVEELVRSYPKLDGLQFDYIRYPDWHPDYGWTKINVGRFKKETGREPYGFKDVLWEDWKRSQVTRLLERLVHKAREAHSSLQISTTALAPYSRAYTEADQDWKSWLEKGTVDFITLMGYATDAAEFEKRIADAEKKLGNLERVNIAVGAYAMAGLPEIFKTQLKICEESGSRACAVLHYGSLKQNPSLGEAFLRDFGTSFKKD